MSVFSVYVTPKSSKNAVLGIENGEVRVKVTAPPDHGKANKAVCKILAGELGVPKSSVEVTSGHTSRHKRITIAASQEQLEAWLFSLPVLK